MSDYFDELENGLKAAIRRGAHKPWYSRLVQLSATHRGLAVLLAAFAIVTPTVAVGAGAGWFSAGSPDLYNRAPASIGLGQAAPTNGRLLSIRVADPDGGPPWGVRLVKTSRGETCIQVGRVVNGQIGSLGIDGAWHNDHKFHEIEPNDLRADICGATDAAGDGFVSRAFFGAPASVDVPLDNSGSRGRCANPLSAVRTVDHTKCPAAGMRVIFAGLLGPDARRITYKAMSGRAGSRPTSGGVGAYLLVFRETGRNCRHELTILDSRCPYAADAATPDLQAPTAVTSVTYASGHTCSTQPSVSFASAYTNVARRLANLSGALTRRRYQRIWPPFLHQQHLTNQNWLLAARPECQPVGWVDAKVPKLSSAQVVSPITVKLDWRRAICFPQTSPDVGLVVIPCSPHRAKSRVSYGQFLVVTVSFIARQPVRTDQSFYEVAVKTADNSSSYWIGTDHEITPGQRITLSTVGFDWKATYHGTVSFIQSTGPQGRTMDPGIGKLVVGRFTIKLTRLPLKH